MKCPTQVQRELKEGIPSLGTNAPQMAGTRKDAESSPWRLHCPFEEMVYKRAVTWWAGPAFTEEHILCFFHLSSSPDELLPCGPSLDSRPGLDMAMVPSALLF